MTLNGVMGSGAMAVQAGMDRLNSAAREIAAQPISPLEPVGRQPTGPQGEQNRPADVVEPLLAQNEALYQAQAGVVVMKAADSNMGALLNMFV